MTEEEDLFQRVFFPLAHERTEAARKGAMRFVHYCSADAARNILSKGEVWLRKASCMNDFMEIEHGRRCLVGAYRSQETGQPFQALLESLFPGICSEIAELFDRWAPDFQHHTYITCMSEHLGGREDHLGRLSMWRAYGGVTGVAIVMKGTPFLTPSDALKAYTSPVAYLDPEDFEQEFARVTNGIKVHLDYVRSLGREAVKNTVFEVFRNAVLCTKHPGFKEELEWRVIYQPSLHPSDRIKRDIETINGSPQPVYKVSLRDFPEEGLVGVEIPTLVDRVIIGPTRHHAAVCEAFADILQKAGLPDAARKVIPSTIPLRQ